MDVSLTPELEKFVSEKVATGRYQIASEVVRAGLRLLEARDQHRPGFMVSAAAELQHKVREGLDALHQGEFSSLTPEEIIAEGRARLSQEKPNS